MNIRLENAVSTIALLKFLAWSCLQVKKEAGQIPILHQTRPFSSLAAEQIQTSPNDTNKNILRPLSPHLPIYKPQLSSTLSIAHRITGAFLAASILSFHLLYLKMGPVCLSFAEFYQFLFYSSKLTMVSLELCVLAFAYHMFNGIHHLSRDFRGIIGKRFKWLLLSFTSLLK